MSMNNEENMIPDSIYDTYTQIGNQITILNAQLEMMERNGQEQTAEYETLISLEWDLSVTRMRLRRKIAKGLY